jgi:CRISPR-associated protein Cmr1
MFGGGTETRKVDKDQPIRPTSIRGHLQFWWRATAGARHTQSQSLFADQADIWGSTTIKSKVSISVEATVNPPQISYTGIVKTHSSLKYALFPFSPNNGALEATGVKNGFSFTVTIKKLNPRLSDQQWQEVKDATTAWINFGGIGSRTRRGCGSLFSDKISFSTTQEIRSWLKSKGATEVRHWPTLPKQIYINEKEENHDVSWADTIGLLNYFRQGENMGRDFGKHKNQPLRLGQSRFPEPDTIRYLLNMWDHPPREKYLQKGYPRAEFGLPIIFHFIGQGVPADTTLQPVVDGLTQDRMASPLIFKPLATSATKALPCVFKLNTMPLDEVVLMRGTNEVSGSRQYPIRSSSFAAMNPSPMRGFSSAIDAFLKYAEDEGYTTK